MTEILVHWLIRLLDYPSPLQDAEYRWKFGRETWWDRLRLKIAKRIWREWDE